VAPEGTALLVVALPTSSSLSVRAQAGRHLERVIIGVDPHKLSATIEVVDAHEKLLGSGRFSTDQAGYAAMRRYAKTWPDRVWAVEGANGVGRPLAQRLLEAGEHVVEVPAKLTARVRLFDTGHNCKTDALDAHSIAVVAVRTPTLRVLQVDGELEALRILTDRREALTRRRVQIVGRLQALLANSCPDRPNVTSPPDRPRRCSPASVLVTSPGRLVAGSRPRSWQSWSRSRPR
jgi:hypothetical protein